MTGRSHDVPVARPLPPRVAVVAAELLRRVRAVLGEQFVGLYLYGSLSSGDFDEASSDIDFLVVTRTELPAGVLPELAAMHGGLSGRNDGNPFWQRLEGSYLPVAALRRYDPAVAEHPTVGLDWPFGVRHHGWTWVLERAIVRSRGRALAGPPPGELIDPIGADQLREATLQVLQEFWAPIGAAPEAPGWLATAAYQAFAILTMCRALHTISTGGLASKPAAAAWARDTGHWPVEVDWALVHRADHAMHDPEPMMGVIRQALDEAGVAWRGPGRLPGMPSAP